VIYFQVFAHAAGVAGMSGNAYLATAATNEEDLSPLHLLERAAADFEEQFHQAGPVSVIQVRANKRVKKRTSHSDVVKVEGEDPPPPGCLKSVDSRPGKPGTVTIPQYLFDKTWQHKGDRRVRQQIDATKENLPGSSMRMKKAAAFESGEEPKNKSKTAAQKQAAEY